MNTAQYNHLFSFIWDIERAQKDFLMKYWKDNADIS